MKAPALNYAAHPTFVRRHGRMLCVLAGAASLAAIWLMMVFYYDVTEPFFSESPRDIVFCRMFPFLLMGGCLVWLAMTVLIVRPRWLALILLAIGLPLSILGARDAWRVKKFYEYDVSTYVPPPVN